MQLDRSSIATNRRIFLKTLVASLALTPIGSDVGRFIAPKAHAEDILVPLGTFDLLLSEYPALQMDYGSVYFSVPGIEDIIITRLPASEFHAVTSVCTHAGCKVNKYDPKKRGLQCPCHGARFTADGSIISGPVSRPLQAYPVSFDGGDRIVLKAFKYTYRIQMVSFRQTVIRGSRLAITFHSEVRYVYLVMYLADLSGDPSGAQPASFALSPDGEMDQNWLDGAGQDEIVYVDATASSGFFFLIRFR